jgi:hypothetical protein
MRYAAIHGFRYDYHQLRAGLPARGNAGMRSHEDITERDVELRTLIWADVAWMRLWQDIHSYEFWLPYLNMWNIRGVTEDLFDPNFIEDRTGGHGSDDIKFFGRMDIGYGDPGYGVVNGGKGLHIDRPNRIMSGLLYFTDQSELEGGEFMAMNQGLDKLTTIPLEENLAIISVQDKDGMHMVRPLSKGRRVAVYFALSCTEDYWDR